MVFVLGLSIGAVFVMETPIYYDLWGIRDAITSLPVQIEPAREFGSRSAWLEWAGPGRADISRRGRPAPGDRNGSGRYR